MPTLTLTPQQSLDDGYQHRGTPNLTVWEALGFIRSYGHADPDTRTNTMMRFPGASALAGATINSASLKIWPYSANWDDVIFTVYGHKVANSPVLNTGTTHADNVNSRLADDPTTASSSTGVNTDVGVGAYYTVPESGGGIKAIVEEIIAVPGWAGVITLLTEGWATGADCRWRDYDNGVEGQRPLLTIDYTPGAQFVLPREPLGRRRYGTIGQRSKRITII